MNPARSNLISANSNACTSILMSLQLELPQLSPPAMSRASSLARRCSGIAWPLQQQSRQQLLQQQASSSFLHVEECVHVIFFTPEEAAAVASSSSSLISTIMRSRANIFPVPAPFARQSHVTILATSGEHAAQKLRSATRSNGVRGGPIVIDLNHGLSGEINLPALAAIIHQGSNCLASSSSVLFVDIITQENIFTELSLAVHHDMMNASHTAEWSHDGSLDSSTTHLRFKSANRQHVQSSWFAGDMSCLTCDLSPQSAHRPLLFSFQIATFFSSCNSHFPSSSILSSPHHVLSIPPSHSSNPYIPSAAYTLRLAASDYCRACWLPRRPQQIRAKNMRKR